MPRTGDVLKDYLLMAHKLTGKRARLARSYIDKAIEIIEEGPSEEDEETVLNNARHLLEGGTLSRKRQMWMAAKLKELMGI